jgi:hypothetical protein
MKEWIDHYIMRGVDHIYMIDDGSTDSYMTIIEPYISKNIVTLFKVDIVNEDRGMRQCAIYHKFFRPILQSSTWFSILDLDEFMYCPESIRIDEVLKTRREDQLITDWVCFGSSGLIDHPSSIVDNFTKRYTRETAEALDAASHKSTFRTNKFLNFGVHKQVMTQDAITENAGTTLLVNHYLVQSLNFWRDVKMTRGDCNRWHSTSTRNMEYFRKYDVNEEDDFRLKYQTARIRSLQPDEVLSHQ